MVATMAGKAGKALNFYYILVGIIGNGWNLMSYSGSGPLLSFEDDFAESFQKSIVEHTHQLNLHPG